MVGRNTRPFFYSLISKEIYYDLKNSFLHNLIITPNTTKLAPKAISPRLTRESNAMNYPDPRVRGIWC